MYFPDDEKWKSWGISHELEKFFLLRWQELFAESTFDSWQIRFSNTPSLLREILKALDVVERLPSSHRNIDILITEALQTSKREEVIARSFPFVGQYLHKIRQLYSEKVKNNKDLETFRRVVTVTLGSLRDYREKLESLILETISNPPAKGKIFLNSLIMSLGVELLSIGYSIHSLRKIFQRLCGPRDLSFQERLKNVLADYNGKVKKYECMFFITWPDKFPELGEYNIRILQDRPGLPLTSDEHKFYQQDSQSPIAIVEVESLDEFSARDASEESLNSLFAVHMLYRVSKQVTIKHDLALVVGDGSRLCIGLDSSRLRYIKDSKQPTQNIAAFTKLQSRLAKEDAGQLNASIQYHKLALKAANDDARLVNLWIALESLVQHGGESIIDRICKYLPASIAIGYVYQVLRNLPIAIRKMWRNSDTGAIRSLLGRSDVYKLHPFDLLKILFDKEDGPLISEFSKLIGNHSLLHFRIYQLKNKLFKDANTLSKRIESHKQNIDWQIRRIYRARNHVMHSGVCWPGTRQLVQHLHSYFIIGIHNLLHDLSSNPEWTIPDAFEHRLAFYDYFQQRLKEDPKKKVTIKEIYKPIEIMHRSNNSLPAW